MLWWEGDLACCLALRDKLGLAAIVAPRCDVKCNHAWRKAAPSFAWLAADLDPALDMQTRKRQVQCFQLWHRLKSFDSLSETYFAPSKSGQWQMKSLDTDIYDPIEASLLFIPLMWVDKGNVITMLSLRPSACAAWRMPRPVSRNSRFPFKWRCRCASGFYSNKYVSASSYFTIGIVYSYILAPPVIVEKISNIGALSPRNKPSRYTKAVSLSLILAVPFNLCKEKPLAKLAEKLPARRWNCSGCKDDPKSPCRVRDLLTQQWCTWGLRDVESLMIPEFPQHKIDTL